MRQGLLWSVTDFDVCLLSLHARQAFSDRQGFHLVVFRLAGFQISKVGLAVAGALTGAPNFKLARYLCGCSLLLDSIWLAFGPEGGGAPVLI